MDMQNPSISTSRSDTLPTIMPLSVSDGPVVAETEDVNAAQVSNVALDPDLFSSDKPTMPRPIADAVVGAEAIDDCFALSVEYLQVTINKC